MPEKYFTNPLWKHSPACESILKQVKVVMPELTTLEAACKYI